MLDTNQDGALSLKEARAGLQGQVQPSALRVVFDAYDADDSGSLDVEVQAALSQLRYEAGVDPPGQREEAQPGLARRRAGSGSQAKGRG